jgi:hypothetical protein
MVDSSHQLQSMDVGAVCGGLKLKGGRARGGLNLGGAPVCRGQTCEILKGGF